MIPWLVLACLARLGWADDVQELEEVYWAISVILSTLKSVIIPRCSTAGRGPG